MYSQHITIPTLEVVEDAHVDLTLPQLEVLVDKHFFAPIAVMGVPSDLVVGSGSSVSARESYRRLASATIFPLLQTIMQEWSRKVGPVTFDLSALRASDQVGISRALGSRANAVSKLVLAGVSLDEALSLAGVD